MQTRGTVCYLAWIAVFAATAAAATSPCGAIDGAASVIGPETIVLVGEMHGTEQSPPFVADLACIALARDLSVTVALEVPEEEAPLVTAYLDSDGGDAARAALLSGPLWTDDYQDGRRSAAELALLESLRRDRRAGLPVRVALLDRRTWKEPAGRDAYMASRLAAGRE